MDVAKPYLGTQLNAKAQNTLATWAGTWSCKWRVWGRKK